MFDLDLWNHLQSTLDKKSAYMEILSELLPNRFGKNCRPATGPKLFSLHFPAWDSQVRNHSNLN